MKQRILFLLVGIVPFFFGPLACKPQANPTPPQYTAPTAGNGAYTQLNPPSNTANPPVSGLNYVDKTPPAGTESCYVVQGYLATGAQYSGWSNTSCSEPGTTGEVTLTWTCTVPNPNPNNNTCTQLYVVSRAAAVVAAGPTTPVQGNPTSSEVEKPEGPTITLAANPTAAKLEKR